MSACVPGLRTDLSRQPCFRRSLLFWSSFGERCACHRTNAAQYHSVKLFHQEAARKRQLDSWYPEEASNCYSAALRSAPLPLPAPEQPEAVDAAPDTQEAEAAEAPAEEADALPAAFNLRDLRIEDKEDPGPAQVDGYAVNVLLLALRRRAPVLFSVRCQSRTSQSGSLSLRHRM